MSTEKRTAEGTSQGLTAAEQAAFTAWAELIETDDYEPRPSGAGVALEGDAAVAYSRSLLADLGVDDEPAETTGRGRPKVGGAGKGESPKRQVRLSEELDAKLTERAQRDETTAAAVMRDAIEFYLNIPESGVVLIGQLKKLNPEPIARRAFLANAFAARLRAHSVLTNDDRDEIAEVLRDLGSLAAFEAKTLHASIDRTLSVVPERV